jgi:hypothetical protein
MERTTADILDPKDWMSTQELAALLNVTVGGIEYARAKGIDHPPWYRHGQRVRYRRSEVAKWLMTKRHIPAVVQLAEQQAA